MRFKLLLEGILRPPEPRHSPTIRPLILNGNGRIDGVNGLNDGSKSNYRSLGNRKNGGYKRRKNSGSKGSRMRTYVHGQLCVKLLKPKHTWMLYERPR